MAIFLSILLLWLLSLCLHEYAHARVAYAGGDTSVEAKGYLSLNPLRYIHPMMSIGIPLLILAIGGVPLPGGAVYIDHSRLRSRHWEAAVSAAGPAANAAILLLCALPFLLGLYDTGPRPIHLDPLTESPRSADVDPGASPLAVPPQGGEALWMILGLFAYFQALALVINLLPVPGLDGFGILEPYLPHEMRQKARQWSNFGVMLLIILLILPNPVSDLVFGITAAIPLTLGVPDDLIIRGYHAFRGALRF